MSQSSQQTQPPLWAPSIGVALFLIALIGGLFAAKSDFLTDPATARHLHAGAIALESGPVLSADPFTFSLAEQPWIQHQWLFDIFTAWLEKVGGVPLVYAFGQVLFALIPFAVWRLLETQRILWPVALLYVCFVLVIFQAHWLLRPQLLNYLLLPVFLAAWYRYPNALTPLMWAILLPLMIVWTNVHGGFVSFFVILGAALAGRAIDNSQAQKSPLGDAEWRWIIFGGGAALATLLNPFGWQLHQLIWEMVFHLRSYAYYDEYQPPNYAVMEPLAFAFLLVVGLIIIGRFLPGRTPLGWETVLPVVVFAWFASDTKRHVLLLVLVAAVPICRDFDGFLRWLLAKQRPALLQRFEAVTRFEALSRVHYWLVPLFATVLIGVFIAQPSSADLRVANRNISPEAVEVLAHHKSFYRKPLTTTWNGGPLVYHLAKANPDFRVSYDDRNEFHGDRRMQELVHMLKADFGWQTYANQGGYDSAILSPNTALVEAMIESPKWKLTYKDDSVVMFIRHKDKKPGKRPQF